MSSLLGGAGAVRRPSGNAVVVDMVSKEAVGQWHCNQTPEAEPQRRGARGSPRRGPPGPLSQNPTDESQFGVQEMKLTSSCVCRGIFVLYIFAVLHDFFLDQLHDLLRLKKKQLWDTYRQTSSNLIKFIVNNISACIFK